jgi:hypothetical protein
MLVRSTAFPAEWIFHHSVSNSMFPSPATHNRALRGRTLRLVLAALATVVIVPIVLFSRGDDDDPTARVLTETTRAATTSEASASTTTTVFQIEIAPNWVPKESSLYSESEESKLLRDELGAPTTTTTLPGSSEDD